MDRREAVLRELNLYPLWMRRDQPARMAGDPLPAEAVAESAPPVDAELTAHKVSANADTSITVPSTALDGLGWPELKQRVHDCTACKLRAGCTQTVFGVGDEKADWLFIGEGPGADEDALGEPFVGQAGKLLDNMLLAIKLKRGNNVYIANVVKCRPPGNRTPAADEIATCLPYLQRQIELMKPKLIVALGKVASNALLGREATLASLRGKLHDYQGIPLIVTYHPAYLLRSPTEKAKAWQDLLLAVHTMQKT
ncbi:MAG: uracil-DNA glycosylase [Gallionella sp.]